MIVHRSPHARGPPSQEHPHDDHTVALAKAWLIHEYDRRTTPREDVTDRPWHEACVPKNSYNDPAYHTRILVREGSPPKGFVVESTESVWAWTYHGKMKHFSENHVCDEDYINEHAWARTLALLPVEG